MSEINAVIPWYKHYWVWIIISLLSSAVIASFITLFIAIKNAPDILGEGIRDQIHHQAQIDE